MRVEVHCLGCRNILATTSATAVKSVVVFVCPNCGMRRLYYPPGCRRAKKGGLTIQSKRAILDAIEI